VVSAWTPCMRGVQTRVVLSGEGPTCPHLQRSCLGDTDCVVTEWGVCDSAGQQARRVLQPATGVGVPCPALTRSCVYSKQLNDLPAIAEGKTIGDASAEGDVLGLLDSSERMNVRLTSAVSADNGKGGELGAGSTSIVGLYGRLEIGGSGTWKYVPDLSNKLVDAYSTRPNTLEDVFEVKVQHGSGAEKSVKVVVRLWEHTASP